jgi:hypothetical protein
VYVGVEVTTIHSHATLDRINGFAQIGLADKRLGHPIVEQMDGRDAEHQWSARVEDVSVLLDDHPKLTVIEGIHRSISALEPTEPVDWLTESKTLGIFLEFAADFAQR